jgi:hypothetical protein
MLLEFIYVRQGLMELAGYSKLMISLPWHIVKTNIQKYYNTQTEYCKNDKYLKIYKCFHVGFDVCLNPSISTKISLNL